MGLWPLERLMDRSTKFEANPKWITGSILIDLLFTPFYDSAIGAGAGSERRILKPELNPCAGFEGKFGLKVDAVSAHVIYLAVRKRAMVFIFQQNRFIVVKALTLTVVNCCFHPSPPYINA
jgi:hypothetical protein